MENQANIRVAFIIDDIVVDMINTDERLAAIMLSEPLVIDITGMVPGQDGLYINSKYNPETKTFTPPQYNEEGNLV